MQNKVAILSLSGTLIAFTVLAAYMVGATLSPREAAQYEISSRTVRGSPMMNSVWDTVTIDARDERRWTFFDFERGSAMSPPDTNGWDLAFRRFSVIASGRVADAGVSAIDDSLELPDHAYVGTEWGRDTTNTAIERWYDYGFLTHLLTPKDHVYAVRSGEHGSAKLRFLSYYCPGMVPGCVTFEYVFRTDQEG